MSHIHDMPSSPIFDRTGRFLIAVIAICLVLMWWLP